MRLGTRQSCALCLRCVNLAEPKPCQSLRPIGFIKTDSLEPTGRGEMPRLLRLFTTLIRPCDETFRDFCWAHCLRKLPN